MRAPKSVVRASVVTATLALFAAVTACSGKDGSAIAPVREEGSPTSPATRPSGSASGSDETGTPPPPASARPGLEAGAPPPGPTPSAADYMTEKTWAAAHGITIPAGKVFVLAKRHGAVARSESYTDEILVFRVDGTLSRFTGTTKPAQLPSANSSVPDVDGNGTKDLGIVRPGTYEAHGNETVGLPGHERAAFRLFTKGGDANLPAWRDTSGDGVFSQSERDESEQYGDTMSGIRLHYGFDVNGTAMDGQTYTGPWTIGDQNVTYADLDDFVAAVGGPTATFPYAIVQD